MELLYVQICVLLALCVGNAVAGLMPFTSNRLFKSSSQGATCRKNRISSFFLQFGGGIFMTICFLVLIPKAREKFETHDHEAESGHQEAISDDGHHHEGFPIPEFIVLCGYFLTFVVEEVLHHLFYHCRRKSIRLSTQRVRFCSCAKRHTECSRAFKADLPEETLFGYERRRSSADVLRTRASSFGKPVPSNAESNLLESSIMSQPVPNYGTVENVEISSNKHIPVLPTAPTILEENETERPSQNQEKCSRYPSSISNAMLLIAVSIYSIFQGALIQKFASTSAWYAMVLLVLQQLIIHLTLGNIYLSSSNLVASYIFIALSSIMAPLGIMLSMFLPDISKNIPGKIVGSICSIVCGCLLYLSFNDLLRRHVLRKVSGLQKLAAFSVGSGIIALFVYLSTIF